MKIIKGILNTEEFQPEEQGWNAINEPNIIMAQIIALPIRVAAVVCVVILASFLQLTENYSFA